jgi:pimeloyl-ACP methyl ester carboxylesterase
VTVFRRPPTTAILVHGLWHGGWAWDAVRDLLAERGVASVAPDLPLTSLAADVAAVDAVLDVVPGPAVLVGHSYGGAVVTAAGDAANVAALVFVAGFALQESESISRTAPDAGVPPTRLGEAVRFSADGAEVLLDPELGREVLYNGTPAPVADAALSRLRPVARGLFSARPQVAAWRQRRSVYAICTDDACVAPDLQRVMAARLDEQVEWDSDHSAPSSHPDLVADLVARVVAEVAAGSAETA